MYISALCPPNNADIAFLRMKRELFHETSMLSVWALRPMVPFALFSQRPEKPERGDLPAIPWSGLKFTRISQTVDQMYLESGECLSLCAELRSMSCFTSVSSFDASISGGFQAVPGLHLLDLRDEGASDAEASVEQKIRILNESEVLWRGCSLSLFLADFSEGMWWEHLTLEQLWEVPLQQHQ